MVLVQHEARKASPTRAPDLIDIREEFHVGDHRMRSHEHQNSHLVMCFGGEIETHSGQESFLQTEKSFAYVPAFVTHSNIFRGNARTFQITLNEEDFGITPRQTKSKSFPRLHHSASLMVSLFHEFKFPDNYSRLMLHSLVTELLVSIHRDADSPGASDCRTPWLLQVRDLLHEELSETLRLDCIAAKIGVHPAHLTKAFRKHFGQSIGQYVRRLRIERARHLLESSDLSIGEIALATGFVDQCHFTRTFKGQTGRTPYSYRAKH